MTNLTTISRTARALSISGMIALSGFLLNGCDSGTPSASSTEETAPERIKIVATTGMIADMARSIGGDLVEVTTLVGVGVDPHLYKPTRDDVARLLSADLVLYNGLHLEGQMEDVLERAGADRPTVAVTAELPKALLIEPGDGEEHEDPHVWLSPEYWGLCGVSVRQALSDLAPEHNLVFNTNFQDWFDTAEELRAYGAAAIGSIPSDSRLLITSHDAFGYFGRAFDLEVMAIQGISTESEAGLADLEEMVALVVERRIPTVFIESSVPRRSIEALIEGAAARGQEVTIGGELYSDSMGPAGSDTGTWRGMIIHDITTITTALGGTLPESAPTPPGTDAMEETDE